MSTASLLHFSQRDALRPPNEDGFGAGFAFAAGAHVLLITALAFGVNWQSSEPASVSAELWAAVPQAAAPRAVEPPPAPPPPAPKPEPKVETPPPKPAPAPAPDPQIAIEKEKEKQKRELKAQQDKEAEEKKALEAKKAADKAELDKKKKETERQAAQLEAQRQDNLKRILGQAGATGDAGATGTAARSAGPSASYGGKIMGAIRPNIVLIDSIEGNPRVEIELRAGPDGSILSRRVTKSSGVKEWDETVLRAIDRTATLPRDEDGRVPSTLVIGFRPRDF